MIFDPFGGSGTLARVAEQLGRCFFTTEKDTTYFQYMKEQNTSILNSKEDKYLTIEEFKESIQKVSSTNIDKK